MRLIEERRRVGAGEWRRRWLFPRFATAVGETERLSSIFFFCGSGSLGTREVTEEGIRHPRHGAENEQKPM